MRHTKTVDGVVYTYYYVGDKLVRETYGDTVMDFFYDQNGQPYAMKYNDLMLYYILNQQGDVVRLVTNGGTSYGIYRYDAWGNILYSTDNKYLNDNPLRYRGYVYDAETKLYYLQSRYYDPNIGRFINADALVSTGQGILGNNMFAYCGNNPVNMIDPSGYWPQWLEDLWDAITDFFSNETGTESVTYDDGSNSGYASVTSGYSEFTLGGLGQNQVVDRNRDIYQNSGFAGVSGSVSVIHANAGGGSWQNENMGLMGDATIDVLSLTGYAGYEYSNGLGIGAGAYAAALSGSATATFDIYGWKLVLGADGDLGAFGFEARLGFTNGVAECKFKGAAGIGGGFIVQVIVPERYY